MSFLNRNNFKPIDSKKLLQFSLAVLVSLSFLFYQENAKAADAIEYMNGTIINQTEMLYIPGGFDDNDPVVIMAYGEYDMSCEEIASHDFLVDQTSKTVVINTRKISHANESDCSNSYEPYYKEFRIGTLEAGVYNVIGNGPEPIKKTLVIKKSDTNQIDKFDYPEIVEVRLGLRPDGKAYLYVDIPLKDRCQVIDSIEVKRQGDHFWELYPKMTLLKKDNCKRGQLIQTKEVVLGKIPFNTHIFYIRSNKGESNFYFEALI